MKNVLIVEDNTQLQDLYREALNKSGITELTVVDTVPKGMTALGTKKFDLVVLDIMLPEGNNGFDMLEQMKKDPRLATVPVMVITNLDSQEQSARDIGVVDYIVKSNTPFEKIVEKIMACLA